MSITDFGIRVLAMPGGQVLHNLSIHTSEQSVAMAAPAHRLAGWNSWLAFLLRLVLLWPFTPLVASDHAAMRRGKALRAAAQCPDAHNSCFGAGHVHVLECHPVDPALAFSASYDGTVAVWHMRSGQVLHRFSRSAGPWPPTSALLSLAASLAACLHEA